MSTGKSMFDDVAVIGKLSFAEQAARIKEIEGESTPAAFSTQAFDPANTNVAKSPFDPPAETKSLLDLFNRSPRPWQNTTHQFGYIAPRLPGDVNTQPLRAASTIEPGKLENSRINIRLSRLRVIEYPGSGLHQVLFTFKAQNQVANALEPVSFSQTYRVQQGQLAGIVGYPVFIGLTVGNDGVAFQCFTVNVKNDNDQKILDFLDSPAFQGGLNLLTTAQPVLKPFAGITLDLAKMMAKRNENIPVQDFYMGMDFGTDALGVRLALGDYIAAQVPDETTIDWKEWVFDPTIGAIVKAENRNQSLPYNYVAFSVSEYKGP